MTNDSKPGEHDIVYDLVRFRDISVPLKIAVILAWITGIIITIIFTIGFIQGVLLAVKP